MIAGLDIGLLALLLVVMPGLSILQAPTLRRLLLSHGQPNKVLIYHQAMITQIGMSLLALAVWRIKDRSLAELGLVVPLDRGFWAASAIAAGLGLVLLLLYRGVLRRPAWRRFTVRNTPPIIARLLPETVREVRQFMPAAVTAGVCEELLYRGIAVALLQLFGVAFIPAVVLSALAFGLMHAYQGLRGVALTALMGLGFSALVWLGGSLWPAIALHALYDWLVGRLNMAMRDGL